MYRLGGIRGESRYERIEVSSINDVWEDGPQLRKFSKTVVG
jgi:hypothetical protein